MKTHKKENSIFISYKWAFRLEVTDANGKLIKDYPIESIGENYREAKEILAILLKNRNLLLQTISSCAASGINVAYYEDGFKDLSPTELKKLVLPEPPDEL